MRLPFGHELIHQRHKARIVFRLEQVNHLMDDNIFKTFHRLSGEISIQSKEPVRSLQLPHFVFIRCRKTASLLPPSVAPIF